MTTTLRSIMVCCKCNRTGLCRNCACVKAKRNCSDCLPKRQGNCGNYANDCSLPLDSNTATNTATPLSNTPISHSHLNPSQLQHVQNQSKQPQDLTSLSSPTHADELILPPFAPLNPPIFNWGELDATEFSKSVEEAYTTVVHWKKNCFTLPYGKAGKEFVGELSRLYLAFGTSSTLESIALRATVVLPLLLLQKSNRSSKAKDHTACLERRMALWRKGALAQLVEEGRAIQNRLPKMSTNNHKNSARSFANLMFAGKCKAALDILSSSEKSTLLHLDDPSNPQDPNSRSVKDVLISKHPAAQKVYKECVVAEEPEDPHPIIFDAINSESIRSSALRTTGAAGPSGLDAHTWRRLCTSYKGSSRDLCESLASVARRLCSTHVDPQLIAPLLACRLIALDKNPGVRPIGIGDVARRIIAKAIIHFSKEDIQQACGCQQLCGGQISGVEACVHAVRTAFEADESQAMLLVDASNAFNSVNRQVALHNIRRICPLISTILTNTYRQSTELFVNGDSLLSEEGTTQGDPLAMAMYGLATIPLIRRLERHCKQVWYADDSAAIGHIDNICNWWKTLVKEGPQYGYFPNPTKTWLVVKEQYLTYAKSIFANTGVSITANGRPYLGAAIGTERYVEEAVNSKVIEWSSIVTTLGSMAKTQPHAAYSALTHGLMSKWTYLSRVIPNIGHLLTPLDDSLQTNLIPALTGRSPPNNAEVALYALPARLGGLGIGIPSKNADRELRSSLSVCAPLIEGILSQDHLYSSETLASQLEHKKNVRKANEQRNILDAEEVYNLLPSNLRKSTELAREKGASSWLTTLPLSEHGFTLHKGAFHDALALRYGWPPTNTPTNCDCGKAFTVEHALSCPKGGFPILRHNEIRDLTATLLSEVCNDVRVEPELQRITEEQLAYATSNTQDGARLDISANGVWGGRFEKTYFDVRVFNPHAPSNKHNSLKASYIKHEREKKRSYEQRIREIEHSSFTPLVLSATGGLGREATIFYKRLASLLSHKWNNPYSKTFSWLRCRLTFSLLRSSILAIRGARSSRGNCIFTPSSIDLTMEESKLQSSET